MSTLQQQEKESQEVCALSADLDSSLACLARTESDVFVSYVLKTEKGEAISQGAIHREIQWHIDECRRRGEHYCGILAPWGHGKTEQVAIGRTLNFLGENRNHRVFIVCNTDDNAKARVQAIRNYIMTDADYHKVFPEVKEAQSGDWSKHKIVVERESMSKDGSVEAWGITTSGTGSRCDFIIFDDPVDLRNAIQNPAMRPVVKQCFNNVWMSRLVPGGFAIYIATIWHQDDNTNELLKNPQWKFLVMKISEDFSRIECSSPFKGEYTIPLWEDTWDKADLLDRLKVIGNTAFNRGFRQRAISDEDRTLPSYLKIFKYGLSPLDVVRRDWPRVGGMDPFGKFVVIFTLAVDPGTGKRYPLEIRRGKWGPTESVNQLIDAYNTHRHQIIVVENNAAQDAIVQWALEKGHASMPLLPFATGKQKVDPMLGLPGMEVEFANNSWIVAMGNAEHEPDCKCGFCVWKSEMGSHPVGEASDTVMASWFAREAARAITLGLQPQEDTLQEEVVTAEEAGLETVKIGNY